MSPVFSHQSFDVIRLDVGARNLVEVVSRGEIVVTCKVVFTQKLVHLLARNGACRGRS